MRSIETKLKELEINKAMIEIDRYDILEKKVMQQILWKLKSQL